MAKNHNPENTRVTGFKNGLVMRFFAIAQLSHRIIERKDIKVTYLIT